jgi:GDP-mannose 6-dehydrogenase
VIGVDRRREVVDALRRGVAPIPERGLAERIERARALGTLEATTDLAAAVAGSSATLVCVGTPVGPDGNLDIGDVMTVCETVARAVPEGGGHVIVIRSTVPQGLYRRVLSRLAEVAPDKAIAVALNPEFLREGSAIHDLEDPELVVYATQHEEAARFCEALYADHAARIHRTDPQTAEILKLVNNAWHALKVSFANEVARIARPAGVDPMGVMELLCADSRLNTSAAYLRPGMPFGGACLTKDVASLVAHANDHGVDAPVLRAVLPSNDAHLEHIVAAILAHAPKRVAIVGVGFKPEASDVRDSAPVKLVHRLLANGLEVTVADSAILDSPIPPLGLDALRAALGDGGNAGAEAAPNVQHAALGADVIVVGHPSVSDRRALVALRPTVPVLDVSGELSRALSDDERALLAPVVVLSAHS